MKKQIITIAILSAAVSLTGCSVNINDETMSAAKDIAVSVLDDTDIKVNGQPVDVTVDSNGDVNVSVNKTAAAKPGEDLFGGYVLGDTAVMSKPDANSETLIPREAMAGGNRAPRRVGGAERHRLLLGGRAFSGPAGRRQQRKAEQPAGL